MSELIDGMVDHLVMAELAGFVPATDNGRMMRGACPLHGGDNTTAFSIEYADQGGGRMFHWMCRTKCGTGGGAVRLASIILDVSLDEAAEWIATRFNIKGLSSKDPEDARRIAAQCDALRHVREMRSLGHLDDNPVERSKYLNEGFVTQCVERGCDYFVGRGFDKKLLDKFQVGTYMGDGGPWWKTGYPERATVPIRHHDGSLAGLSGRVLDDNADVDDKYRTLMGTRKDILYGLNLALPEIRNRKAVIITEGFADSWAFWRHGRRNTVASLGCIGSNAMRILMSLTNTVVVAMDNDDAGEEMTERMCRSLSQIMTVYVVKPPKGVDFDELSERHMEDCIRGYKKFSTRR
jgi:DNA primase